MRTSYLKILAAIIEFKSANPGKSPTYPAIIKISGVNSTSLVYNGMKYMEAEGYILIHHGKDRMIEVVKQPREIEDIEVEKAVEVVKPKRHYQRPPRLMPLERSSPADIERRVKAIGENEERLALGVSWIVKLQTRLGNPREIRINAKDITDAARFANDFFPKCKISDYQLVK